MENVLAICNNICNLTTKSRKNVKWFMVENQLRCKIFELLHSPHHQGIAFSLSICLLHALYLIWSHLHYSMIIVPTLDERFIALLRGNKNVHTFISWILNKGRNLIMLWIWVNIAIPTSEFKCSNKLLCIIDRVLIDNK